jgi:hypothetical protein
VLPFSSTPSSRQRPRGPVWGCPSAARSSSRTAADFGLLGTPEVVQLSTSLYQLNRRRIGDQ